MTLYERCITEIIKPEMIDFFGEGLTLLPAETKNDILLALCKNGFMKGSTILRHLVNVKLVAVDFSECEVDDDMLSCLHDCTHLRKLDLRLVKKQGRKFTKNGLLKLFPHITLLEALFIPNCKYFTDEVTKKLCDWCVNLKQLHIPYSSITNLSLFLIGQQLHTLSVLNILGTGVNDRGIELLVKGPLYESLTEVNVERCPNVTPVAKVTLATTCKNIKIYTTRKPEWAGVCFQFRGVLPIARDPDLGVWKTDMSDNELQIEEEN